MDLLIWPDPQGPSGLSLDPLLMPSLQGSQANSASGIRVDFAQPSLDPAQSLVSMKNLDLA